MARFRKKPVEIEAVQWVGNVQQMEQFCGIDFSGLGPQKQIVINTLEGAMTANIGDWIIRGVQGEFYPCKPDIFEATYEAVPEQESE